MLHSITIQNCFAHQDSTYRFQPGLTAITGPNGSGKSQVLEMTRFALWGAAALRTEASDYKGARVVLDFEVRGVLCQVTRTPGTAKLTRDGAVLASGTRPVNAKIVELFGYGLDVFDTANVANQGLIEALSAMRPAERKRLVDSTVGLNLLDDLARWCGDEAQARAKQAAALRSVLNEPLAPAKPAGYRPAAELAPERARLVALADEWRDLVRRVAAVPDDCPEPQTREHRTLDELTQLGRDRTALMNQRQRLAQELAALPETGSVTEAQLQAWEREIDLYEAHTAAIRFEAGYPTPKLSHEEIDREMHVREIWSEYETWRRLKDMGHHTCPECAHQWPIKQDEMGCVEWPTPPEQPTWTLNSLREMRLVHDLRRDHAAEAVQSRLVLAAHGPGPAVPPPYGTAEIVKMRLALARAPQRDALRAELQAATRELDATPPVAEAIAERRAFERAHAAWSAVQEARAGLPAMALRMGELSGIAAEAEAASTLLTECTVYERMWAQHVEAQARHRAALAQVAGLDAERDEYARARAALAEVKTRVKTYLVPSLSRVASGIVARMTGGALSEVSVSEEFDIRVGSTAIDGLSGAGRAAANLALRIGLGQVLTNRVFSVFMADEIDASMDDSRAGFVAEALRNLGDHISQIILVSHKKPDADHYISL